MKRKYNKIPFTPELRDIFKRLIPKKHAFRTRNPRRTVSAEQPRAKFRPAKKTDTLKGMSAEKKGDVPKNLFEFNDVYATVVFCFRRVFCNVDCRARFAACDNFDARNVETETCRIILNSLAAFKSGFAA